MFRDILLAGLLFLTISAGIASVKDSTLANNALFGGFAVALYLVITWEN